MCLGSRSLSINAGRVTGGLHRNPKLRVRVGSGTTPVGAADVTGSWMWQEEKTTSRLEARLQRFRLTEYMQPGSPACATRDVSAGGMAFGHEKVMSFRCALR